MRWMESKMGMAVRPACETLPSWASPTPKSWMATRPAQPSHEGSGAGSQKQGLGPAGTPRVCSVNQQAPNSRDGLFYMGHHRHMASERGGSEPASYSLHCQLGVPLDRTPQARARASRTL